LNGAKVFDDSLEDGVEVAGEVQVGEFLYNFREDEEPVAIPIPGAAFTHDFLEDNLCILLFAEALDEERQVLHFALVHHEFENVERDILAVLAGFAGESVKLLNIAFKVLDRDVHHISHQLAVLLQQ
jgi:hypothetical protein